MAIDYRSFYSAETEGSGQSRLKKLSPVMIALGGLVLAILVVNFIFPPADFPVSVFVKINRGDTTSLIADKLYTSDIIKSPTTFKIFVRLLGGDKRLQAGSYFFKEPLSVINIALRLTNRFLGYTPLRITIFEGASAEKIAALLASQMPNFDREDFLKKALPLEGKLFPDTYFFSPQDSPADIVFEMNSNFEDRIKELGNDIKKTGKSFNDILIMASIIDREAKTPQDKQIVSGILWKRLAADMPLQVDATFEYFLDKTTFDLTAKDLKTDSPYNTYNHKGLPPTPIANPGWDAILASINPVSSPYWYYLSDKQGIIHYAKTFDEHKKNKAAYL